jgi:hypothetical protein
MRIEVLDHPPQLSLRRLAQLREAIPSTAIGRDRCRREPFSVGEGPEILSWIDRRIHRREVNTGARFGGRCHGTDQTDHAE